MADAWDPTQYQRFAAERSVPFWDLLALAEERLVRPVARMVDLGCGTGELSVAAADRLGVTELLGIDASPAMLDAAAAHRGPGRSFEQGDLGSWSGAPIYDLVLANASLQWVPDHAGVLERWAQALAPEGVLAVQVPATFDHPSHVIAGEVAAGAPFLDALGGALPPDVVGTSVLPPERYAEVLYALGLEVVHVRLQVYTHVLTSTDEVVEWMRGTALNRFTAHLRDELHGPFLDAYRERLLAELGQHTPYRYHFKRIHLVGRRPR